MALPNYQLNVISVTTGRVVAIYDSQTWQSLHYSRELNDIGAFVAVLPYTDAYYAAFAWDNFVEIYRTSPITGLPILEETYLVRSRHRYREGNIEQLVVGGLSLNHLLARRIINPADDPAAVDGYSKKSGAADTVMRDYVEEQCGSLAPAARRFPGLTVAAVLGAGVSINKSYRYDNLFNALVEMADGSGIDFRVERVSDYQTSVIIESIGTDKTRTTNEPLTLPWVGLSPNRRNLQEPSLKVDRTDEKNYVYVLGQGQGEQRLVYEDSTADSTLTPFNRIEVAKDQRNVDKLDTDGLVTAAITELNKRKAIHEFTYKPIVGAGGNVYRRDWDMGDKVTVLWDTEQNDLRIKGVEIQADSDGETIDVSVETIVYA